MDKLYRETKANLIEFEQLLGNLDKAVLADEVNESKQKISSKLNDITNSCDQLDIYVAREPVTRRYDAKLKVDQIRYDIQHLKAAFNNIVYKKYEIL